MNKKHLQIGIFFAYLFAILWGIMTFFPLYVTLLSSVKDNAEILLGMFSWPKVFRWNNYVDAVKIAHVIQAIGNSLFFALSSSVLTILIGMMAAYIMSRKRFKIKPIIFMLFIIGVMVPVHSKIIPVSMMATALRAQNTRWFLVLVYTAFALPQAIFLFTGYLNGVSRELDEAAVIEGCGDVSILFRVLMPVCVPIISTEAILAFIAGYGELAFGMILMSHQDKYTVSRAMLTFTGEYQTSLGPIFACIIIAVIPMIVLYIVFHEKVQSGMLEGAIKG